MRNTIMMMTMIVGASVSAAGRPAVTPGADLLVSRHLDMLAGKRVGMVVNHTSRLMSGAYLVDSLQRAGVTVTALFGPEHGVRGSAGAGEKVADGVDSASGVPVYSLYGERNKPAPGMLKNVDLLLYDIQDVGVRFYTYISTLKLCMEAAAEQHIPFVVLDRPNPLGRRIEGPLLEDSLRSFVGIGPLPVIYGLTAGELATFMNESGWLSEGRKADLSVIWMTGWQQDMEWSETGLPWIAPSPNIPTPATADIYPASCFLEATNVSEGRGTATPFFMFGAPFLDGGVLARALSERRLPGIRFDATSFTPQSSKHKGELCSGVQMKITDRMKFRPVVTGLVILSELVRRYPGEVKLNARWLGKLSGKGALAGFVEKGGDPETLASAWEDEISAYQREAARFFHYH